MCISLLAESKLVFKDYGVRRIQLKRIRGLTGKNVFVVFWKFGSNFWGGMLEFSEKSCKFFIQAQAGWVAQLSQWALRPMQSVSAFEKKFSRVSEYAWFHMRGKHNAPTNATFLIDLLMVNM